MTCPQSRPAACLLSWWSSSIRHLAEATAISLDSGTSPGVQHRTNLTRVLEATINGP